MAVRPCPPSAPRPPPPRMAADPAPARNSPRLRCDGARAGREMEGRAPAFGSATLRHFRRRTGSRCRRRVAVPGVFLTAPTPGMAVPGVFLSRPLPGHSGTGCLPHCPYPGHSGTGCPPPPSPWGTAVPGVHLPRRPRAWRTPRHSPGNGQSTRDGGPQVLQQYLIHPARHRAVLTPTQKPGTRSWIRWTKRPGSPRDADCRAAGTVPGHLWGSAPIFYIHRGEVKARVTGQLPRCLNTCQLPPP